MAKLNLNQLTDDIIQAQRIITEAMYPANDEGHDILCRAFDHLMNEYKLLLSVYNGRVCVKGDSTVAHQLGR